MGRIAATAGLLALCAVVWSPARADVIFNNGIPDSTVGWLSDFDGNNSVDFAEEADDFVLNEGGNVVTDVHWWGVYSSSNSPLTDSFAVRIYNDDGGTPELSAFFELSGVTGDRVAWGVDDAGFTIYEYSVDFAPLVLTAGDTYWLAVINDTSNDTNDDWYWSQAAATGNNWTRIAPDDEWIPVVSVELAFHITGTRMVIPEPATLGLLSIGLVALAFRRRRV